MNIQHHKRLSPQEKHYAQKPGHQPRPEPLDQLGVPCSESMVPVTA